jgi:ribosome maturation factor RimP
LSHSFFWKESGLGPARGIEVVRDVAGRVASSRGFELVDVEFKRHAAGTLVRLFIDKEGGIGLAELQSVSEEVSAILDAEDPIATSYTLEVSSPGLDRPLRHEGDYRRFTGRLARLSTYEPIDGRRRFAGRILGVEAGAVGLKLESEGGQVVRLPLKRIAAGRLEVEFPPKHA